MELSGKRRTYAFWILQLIGWGFINSIVLLVPKEISVELSVFSFIFGMVIGITATSMLRWYLKRFVSFDDFKWMDLGKILIGLCLTSIIFAGLNIVFGYLYIKIGFELTDSEKIMFKGYNNLLMQIFNAFFLVGAWMVTYLGIKLLLKLNQERIERLELNTSLKQAQLNTLKGQINPHFMFNSLNNIRGLMLEDVNRSREMLTKLSEILRYSLTKSTVNDISVREELEVVDNYIDLSKIQFEDRLEFIKKIDPASLDLKIPPMVIQLLIENAAKHGIANLKNGGRIVLTIQPENEELLIEVRNTGKLNISKDSTQLGLKNIKQRLKLLYADKASFTLEEDSDEVVAKIIIPMS